MGKEKELPNCVRLLFFSFAWYPRSDERYAAFSSNKSSNSFCRSFEKRVSGTTIFMEAAMFPLPFLTGTAILHTPSSYSPLLRA